MWNLLDKPTENNTFIWMLVCLFCQQHTQAIDTFIYFTHKTAEFYILPDSTYDVIISFLTNTAKIMTAFLAEIGTTAK